MSEACHNLLLSSLTSFYQKRKTSRDLLHEIISGTSPLSLRVIDWFVTHYAKSNQIIYWINEETNELVEQYPTYGGGSHLRKFHLYLDYRAQLKSYTKLYFDCFRRHTRITFVLESDPFTSIETTVGQLNFFRWAIQNHVLQYIMNHLEQIETVMAKFQKSLKKQPPSEVTAAARAQKQLGGTFLCAPCHVRFD